LKRYATTRSTPGSVAASCATTTKQGRGESQNGGARGYCAACYFPSRRIFRSRISNGGRTSTPPARSQAKLVTRLPSRLLANVFGVASANGAKWDERHGRFSREVAVERSGQLPRYKAGHLRRFFETRSPPGLLAPTLVTLPSIACHAVGSAKAGRSSHSLHSSFFLLPFAFFLSVLANAISLKDYSSFFRSKETPAG